MGDSPNPDFYNILGISKGASILDVCKAYKSLVKKWHPDKNPSNKTEAQAKFQSINEAYEVSPISIYSHASLFTHESMKSRTADTSLTGDHWGTNSKLDPPIYISIYI